MGKTLGRPPKYKSGAVMQEVVDGYFLSCKGEIMRDADGKPVLDRRGYPIIKGSRPPTVTGLALALGFKSRQSLLDYQGKKEFRDIVTIAKLRVEVYAEERLYDRNGYMGARFTLAQNFRWQEQPPELSGGVSATKVNIVYTNDKN